jgi:uncharacterized coiled-coil protein SlyX
MSEPVILAIVALVSAAISALIVQAASIRRAPAQARLDDANADKAQNEAAALIITTLREEVEHLGKKVAALEQRVVESERRATSAEARLAEAEARASESRRVIITLGERLDRERTDNRSTTDQLCILIERLLVCIESPGEATKIDMPGVQAMINNIRSGNSMPRRQNG